MVPLLTNLYNILQRYILNLNITTFPLCFYTRWNMNYKLSDDTKKMKKGHSIDFSLTNVHYT